MKKLSPFDFVKNINSSNKSDDLLKDCKCYGGNKELIPDETDKQYNAFIINRAFANFQDTVFIANELNQLSHIPSKMQYTFYRNMVRPKNRFSKWPKKDKRDEKIKTIMDYYNYSEEKARSIEDLVSVDCINKIQNNMNKGGVNGRRNYNMETK
jgi:hypothetical protein